MPKAMEAIITSPATVPGGFLMPPGRIAKRPHPPASPPSVACWLVTAATGPAVACVKYAIDSDESAPKPPAAAMVRHCGCPPGCDHPGLWRDHVLSSADPQCANTIALSVLVVKPLAVTSNGDGRVARKVPLNQVLPLQQLLSFTGCVPAVSVSPP